MAAVIVHGLFIGEQGWRGVQVVEMRLGGAWKRGRRNGVCEGGTMQHKVEGTTKCRDGRSSN